MNVCLHACVYVCISMCNYACLPAFSLLFCTCVYILMQICQRMYVFENVCIYACMRVYLPRLNWQWRWVICLLQEINRWSIWHRIGRCFEARRWNQSQDLIYRRDTDLMALTLPISSSSFHSLSLHPAIFSPYIPLSICPLGISAMSSQTRYDYACIIASRLLERAFDEPPKCHEHAWMPWLQGCL